MLSSGLTPEQKMEIEAFIGRMAKLPGSRVDGYSKLVGLNESGVHPFIIWVPIVPITAIKLPDLPINGNEFAILKTNGSGLEPVSNSELKEMGFELSPALADRVDASWNLFMKHEAINSVFESVPPLSLNCVGADGSISVSSATGVNWTVVGGLNKLRFNFELCKELPPEITCQMSVLDILRATSGVSWTVKDALQLLSSFSKGTNLPLPSIYNGEDCSVSIGALGSDGFNVNNSDNSYLRLLSCPLGKVGEILLTAGNNIDSQIGAAIIGVFGVASPPVSQLTPFECFRLVCYASSCLLMFSSWMLKPASGGTIVKKKRLNALSHRTAGGAIICAITGIFCNIFAPFPLPYAVCAISICVFFVLSAAAYNAFSK